VSTSPAGPVPADGEFRAQVRDWLAAHVPARPLPSVDTAEGFGRHREWERELGSTGQGTGPTGEGTGPTGEGTGPTDRGVGPTDRGVGPAAGDKRQ
jgi:hypothetical protein